MSKNRNRFGPPNKPRPDSTIASEDASEATDVTSDDPPIDPSSNADPTQSDPSSPPDPDASDTAADANEATQPNPSTTERKWTADDIAAIPAIPAQTKAYAHTHGALASLSEAMRHLGAVFMHTQDVADRAMLTRVQRLHQDAAEKMAAKQAWRGLGTLEDIAMSVTKKEVSEK